MQTLTIKTDNQHAIKLLEELEALHVIEVVRKTDTTNDTPVIKATTLSKRMLGSISPDQARRMRDELNQMRNEWERDF